MSIYLYDFIQISFCRGTIRGIEDGTEDFSHFAAHSLPGHVGTGILLQVKLASLPGNTGKDGDPSGFQPLVGIADDELYAIQAPCYQALQDGSPVDFVLAQRDGDSQDLTLTFQVNPTANRIAALRT
jgi:hypothetical protein